MRRGSIILLQLFTLFTQHLFCGSDLVLPPLQLQASKAKHFWKAGDDQICVLVSTDMTQGVRCMALLASLLSSGYPYIDIFLIDNHKSLDSRQWMSRMAAVLNSRGEGGDAARPQVHISPRTRRSVSSLHQGLKEDDFGHLLLDYVIADLRAGEYSNATRCDYFMTTGGKNLYNIQLIEKASPYMRDKYDIIGMDFACKHTMNNSLVDSRTDPNQQVRASFQTGAIARGAVLFRSNSTESMTFALGFLTPDGTGFTKSSASLDGSFIEDLVRTPGMKSQIIPQLLFIQQ